MATVPTATLSTQDTTIAQPTVTDQVAGFDVVPFLRMSKEEMDDLLLSNGYNKKKQENKVKVFREQERGNLPSTLPIRLLRKFRAR